MAAAGESCEKSAMAGGDSVTGRRTGVIVALALLAAGVTAACQPDDGGLPPVGEELVAIEKARCEADGDIWGRVGPEGAFTCIRRTPDAGKRCTSANDCSGACLARSQSCAPLDPLIGCQEILTASGARAMLCVD
jgi:hypothetical protein